MRGGFHRSQHDTFSRRRLQKTQTTRAFPSEWASSACAPDARPTAGSPTAGSKWTAKSSTPSGMRVSPNACIVIDRAAREHQSGQVTILLHKPVGYVSGQAG